MNEAIAKLAKADPAVTYTPEQQQIIKEQFKGANLTDDEFALFLEIAKRKRLDPLRGQIVATKRNSKDGAKMVIQTTIDGYRLIARRNSLAGIDEPDFGPMNGPYPAWATVTVRRWSTAKEGQHELYVGKVWWEEYYPGNGGDGFKWRQSPRHMLAKCAEALALRKGFPEELDGLETTEETQQIEIGRASCRERV